jgi:hypothetical protein
MPLSNTRARLFLCSFGRLRRKRPGNPAARRAGGCINRCWRCKSKLESVGSRLIIRRGETLAALRQVARETGASAIFWNRRYEPAVIARDAKVKEVLNAAGLEVKCFNAGLLHEPWTIQNQSGKPFQVFTPFWKHCLNECRTRRAAARAQKSARPGQMAEVARAGAIEIGTGNQPGRRACARLGNRERPAQWKICAFLRRRSTTIPKNAIGPMSPARRAFRRICTSAKLVRVKSGTDCARWPHRRDLTVAASWRDSQFLTESWLARIRASFALPFS